MSEDITNAINAKLTLGVGPSPWPPERLAAFNNLFVAIQAYALYSLMMQQANVTDGILIARQQDLRALVLDLAQTFRAV